MIKPVKYKNIFSDWRNMSLQKIAKYLIILISSIIFLAMLIFIFFHDPIINTFLKDRITKSFNETNPEYSLKLGDMHYSIWNNSLGSDSVSLKSTDSSVTYNAASISVGGINWINIILQGDFKIDDLTSSVFDAQDIRINYLKSQNELLLKTLYVSIDDSLIIADLIKYYSLIDDEEFFAKSRFRQTRFRLDIPKIKAIGVDWIPLLEGASYESRKISIYNMFADILVNMDKPYDKSSSKPLMPNEIFIALKKTVKVDSVKIINAQLKYCERYAVKATP